MLDKSHDHTLSRFHKVPDVIFSTTELPKEALVKGSGCLIQAR